MTSPYTPSPAINLTHQAVRTCIRCGDKFESNGPGHRVCKHCKARKRPKQPIKLAKQPQARSNRPRPYSSS